MDGVCPKSGTHACVWITVLVRTSQSQNEETRCSCSRSNDDWILIASQGYKLWDPEIKKVIISRSVKFDEENISVDVDIEKHNTGGTDEVRTVPAVGIKSPVEFPSPSNDSKTPDGTNDNHHEFDSTTSTFGRRSHPSKIYTPFTCPKGD